VGDRRMFSKAITDSDAFLDMPLSTQALYFHLSMKADDDGFVNNPKRIQRLIGASDDDFKLLIAKSFILTFESGVIVIKHWRINNWIRADRKIGTTYTEELDMLRIKDNGAYSLETLENREVQPSDNQMPTKCQPSDNPIKSILLVDNNNYNPLEEVKPIKESKSNKKNISIDIYKLLDDTDMDEEVKEKIREWLTYKTERKEGYKPQGFKSLLSVVKKQIDKYGINAVCDVIDLSMSNGWQGILWKRLEENKPRESAYMQAIKDRVNVVDSWT